MPAKDMLEALALTANGGGANTALLSDGSLFYAIGVAPTNEFRSYQPVFSRVVRSVQLNDGYRSSGYSR